MLGKKAPPQRLKKNAPKNFQRPEPQTHQSPRKRHLFYSCWVSWVIFLFWQEIRVLTVNSETGPGVLKQRTMFWRLDCRNFSVWLYPARLSSVKAESAKTSNLVSGTFKLSFSGNTQCRFTARSCSAPYREEKRISYLKQQTTVMPRGHAGKTAEEA